MNDTQYWTYASEPPLWREDAGRDTLSGACGIRKETLPDAWRRTGVWCTEGQSERLAARDV
jgi:hypothetical protein